MGQTVDATLAALPFIVILVLMVGLRWPAARAASVGFAVALILAWAYFGFEDGPTPQQGRVQPTLGASAEAAFSAATIVWILIGALSIHQLQTRGGGIGRLQHTIEGLARAPLLKVILIVWFFALFLEGAAGFGTPVALTAPLLVAVGFRPIDAVALALLGHSIGVSFGAVGTPVFAQSTITGIPALDLARSTATFHALLGVLMLAFVMILARRAMTAADLRLNAATGSILPWAALAAVAFLLPSFLIARWLGPELPTLGGALAGATIFVAALVLFRRRTARPEPLSVAGASEERSMPLHVAAAPYLVLVALVGVTRLISPVQDALQGVVVSWSLFDGFSGSFQPLYHPGTLLVVSFLLGAAIQRAGLGETAASAGAAARQIAPVIVALLATLGLSRIMVHSGMTTVLADVAADSLGSLWPLFAPFAGVLGTFTTGSATASNILFTDFQQDTAEQLNVSPSLILGAQGFGAAVGNVIAPHNIIAGGATVGLAGREGDVLRKTIVPCLAYASAGGVLALLFART